VTEVAAERLLQNDAQVNEVGLDQKEVDHVTA
jgi:hypothetical protein